MKLIEFIKQKNIISNLFILLKLLDFVIADVIYSTQNIRAIDLKREVEKIVYGLYDVTVHSLEKQSKRKISIAYDSQNFSYKSWDQIKDKCYKKSYGKVYLSHILIKMMVNDRREHVFASLDFFRNLCYRDEIKNNPFGGNKDMQELPTYYSYTNSLGVEGEIFASIFDKKKQISDALDSFKINHEFRGLSRREKKYKNIIIMSTCIPSLLDLGVINSLLKNKCQFTDYYISIIENDKEEKKMTEIERMYRKNSCTNEISNNQSTINEENYILTNYNSVELGGKNHRSRNDHKNKYIIYEADNYSYSNKSTKDIIIGWIHAYNKNGEYEISYKSPLHSFKLKNFRFSNDNPFYKLNINSPFNNLIDIEFKLFGDQKGVILSEFYHENVFINRFNRIKFIDKRNLSFNINKALKNVKYLFGDGSGFKNFYTNGFDWNLLGSSDMLGIDLNSAKGGWVMMQGDDLSSEYKKIFSILNNNTLHLVDKLSKELDLSFFCLNEEKIRYDFKFNMDPLKKLYTFEKFRCNIVDVKEPREKFEGCLKCSISHSLKGFIKLENNLKDIFKKNEEELRFVIEITDKKTSAYLEIYINLYKDIEMNKIWFIFASSHSPLLFKPFPAHGLFNELIKDMGLNFNSIKISH